MKSGPDVLKPATHQCGDHQYNKVTVCFYGLELNPDCVPKSRGLLEITLPKLLHTGGFLEIPGTY